MQIAIRMHSISTQQIAHACLLDEDIRVAENGKGLPGEACVDGGNDPAMI